MNTIECIHQCPIDTTGVRVGNGMAFDGCFYYITAICTPEIMKYNNCFKPVTCISTERVYSCICFDPKNKCFWAAAKGEFGRIFQLNCNMAEVDCLSLGYNLYGEITGLSYNCCEDKLLVALSDSIYKISCSGDTAQKLLCIPGSLITGVLSGCGGLLVTYIVKGTQQTAIYSDCNKIYDTFCIPCSYLIKSIIWGPCTCHNNCCEFIVHVLAIKKGCYPYILTLKICGCLPEFPLSCCECGEECCLCGCPCDCPCCCEDSKADILESIALTEAALSHILNAEGEKLQKVLATTDDIDTIMCVNREINRTIINATHLEHVLYNKLSTVVDDCSPCDPCNPCDPCDPCMD